MCCEGSNGQGLTLEPRLTDMVFDKNIFQKLAHRTHLCWAPSVTADWNIHVFIPGTFSGWKERRGGAQHRCRPASPWDEPVEASYKNPLWGIKTWGSVRKCLQVGGHFCVPPQQKLTEPTRHAGLQLIHVRCIDGNSCALGEREESQTGVHS